MLEPRKTRFVCISDTHNAFPPSSFQLPKGDVLIHAGDLTKEGTLAELERAFGWIEKAEFQVKIIIGGNHDLALDQNSLAAHHVSNRMACRPASSHSSDKNLSQGSLLREEQPAGSSKSTSNDLVDFLAKFPSITYLNHEVRTITLPKPPQTTFKVFGSPRSPIGLSHGSNANRYKAFQYYPLTPLQTQTASSLPVSTTHETKEVLEGPWFDVPADVDLIVTHTPSLFGEDWEEKCSGCIGLGRAITRVKPKIHICGHVHEARGVRRLFWAVNNDPPEVKDDNHEFTHGKDFPKTDSRIQRVQNWKDPGKGTKKLSKVDLKSKENERIWDDCVPHECDNEDKRQTVIVNASILSTSWPYLKGAEKWNKPIVIDLELPVAGVQTDVQVD